ncbi:hypothetical protein EON73_00980 [bacterium]|nr:MAG: hypothetical protein EON73_00980 [bacterium]
MSTNYSPSVNIIRDQSKVIHYIATPNSKRIISQIQDDFDKGLRSFNLIGSYGTGKSSFLLALEQTLLKVRGHFDLSTFSDFKVEVVKIIGSYKSIIKAFAEHLDVVSEKHEVENILSELFNRYHQLGSRNSLLVIVIDELGKFLEFAAKNNPEKELYFLQQLAEFANNSKYQILLLTTVHQNFDTYSYELNKSLRQEWTKVKGRFKELTFNEPVEQLLYLASEHISQIAYPSGSKQINTALSIFENAKAFKSRYSKEVASKLFPLDLLAANVLTLALQNYGQNERSLFSFLESTDQASIIKFTPSAKFPFYNLSNVFDYLINNFYSFLHSKHNPDSASWAAIRQAIEHVENSFDSKIDDYLKVVKTIGLLNTFSAAGAVLDTKFLSEYSVNCLGIVDSGVIIDNLISKSIIRYRKHSKRYVLSEEAEIDIELALIEAGDRVSEISDIPTVLKKFFEFSPVLAKEYSYINGTSRYFQFEISEYPKILTPENEIDGYIQLIFNENIKERDIKLLNEETPSANIYVFYKNSKDIKALLFDLEKTRKVLNENSNDKVAKRELESIAAHQQILLNHFILNNLYSGTADVSWYWNNSIQTVNSKKRFNKLLTKVCKEVYSSAPVFKNELVNKHKISSAIHTAKRNYFKGLVANWDQPDLGIPENKFPPEKMIFRSLLLDNGLSPYKEELNVGIRPGDSFYELINISQQFLNGTKQHPKSLNLFVDILSQKPFKLKQGFIDFWIPSFLFLKRDDFALYCDGIFLPSMTDDTLELLAKKPKDFQIKAFDIDGVRLDIFNSYRTFLNQDSKSTINNSSFIETIKPFLVFYRLLPEYAKQTGRLSKEALSVRNAISKSKDPEITFFEVLPAALGSSIKDLSDDPTLLVNYIETLQNAIKEIRTCFENLVDRFELFIKHEILFEEGQVNFDVIKAKLQQRFLPLKRHLLLTKQKSFVQRIDSLLEDNRAWLSSVCQSLLGKSLEIIRDEEEILLYENFKSMIHDLDSLTELSAIEIDEEKEQVYNLQFITFGTSPQRNTIRVSLDQAKDIDLYIDKVGLALSDDQNLNKLILATLLQKVLENE